MSGHRAAVPHVCQRYGRRRRLLLERAAPMAAGILLVLLGLAVLLATALATVVAP